MSNSVYQKNARRKAKAWRKTAEGNSPPLPPPNREPWKHGVGTKIKSDIAIGQVTMI